jgi:hypothetical protein
MNRIITTGLAVLLPSIAMAQASAHAAAEKQIVANEAAVNAAIEKKDLAAFQKLVPGDAWAIDPTGVSTGADFAKIISEFKIEPGWKIEGSRFLWINDTTVVHAYRWIGKGTMMGQKLPSPAWCSTVWSLKNGQWHGMFHQETEAAPMTPPAPTKK